MNLSEDQKKHFAKNFSEGIALLKKAQFISDLEQLLTQNHIDEYTGLKTDFLANNLYAVIEFLMYLAQLHARNIVDQYEAMHSEICKGCDYHDVTTK